MKKYFSLLAALLVLALAFCFVIKFIIESIEKESYKYKKEVGKNIVIGKDTLQILDYSKFNENFTLSNGTTVSYEFVKQQLKQ